MKLRHSIPLTAALALGAGAARAAQAPTSTDEAREAVRASVSRTDVTARMYRHAAEMMKGSDHQAAWDATRSGDDGERMAARAGKHVEEMMKGLDHQAAWDATDAWWRAAAR
ncbi:hypothetical protein [Anaeromyxobacter dehalogenans]|uniref:Uncharacterized protein n=1 Tax=Anaeromyxobacter dehalogenans (strain 2CP-C) TaxID=290397 RepID=Q2IEB5_ANADE|nr:hypothetical protein [Anaeromyxobacter dehalogenans]ABC82925.1 conserved hypothetical protein [Anaeromyxobacter dehalogenans 2CP-C]